MFHGSFSKRAGDWYIYIPKDEYGGIPLEGDVVLIAYKNGDTGEKVLGPAFSETNYGWWFEPEHNPIKGTENRDPYDYGGDWGLFGDPSEDF